MVNYRQIVASQGETFGALHCPTPLPEMLSAWTDGRLKVTYAGRRMTLADLCDDIAAEPDDGKRKAMKKRLPSQTFCALLTTPAVLPMKCDGTGRHKVNRGYALVECLTGLVLLDFDGVADAPALRDEMMRLPTTLAAKVSSSKKGAHGLVYASTEYVIPGDDTSIRSVYNPRWTVIAATYQERLGLKVDTSACDGTRLFLATTTLALA